MGRRRLRRAEADRVPEACHRRCHCDEQSSSVRVSCVDVRLAWSGLVVCLSEGRGRLAYLSRAVDHQSPSSETGDVVLRRLRVAR